MIQCTATSLNCNLNARLGSARLCSALLGSTRLKIGSDPTLLIAVFDWKWNVVQSIAKDLLESSDMLSRNKLCPSLYCSQTSTLKEERVYKVCCAKVYVQLKYISHIKALNLNRYIHSGSFSIQNKKRYASINFIEFM